VLNDAAKISGDYTHNDVDCIKFDCRDEREGFRWCHAFSFARDLFATFYRNSHILGSVSLGISWLHGVPDDQQRRKFRSIVFSGDIGCNTEANSYQPLLKGRHQPHENIDLMVVESTYGGRDRDPQYQNSMCRQQVLADTIRHTVLEKHGCLVIPAFAMHRVQEILIDLYQILRQGFGENQGDGQVSNSRPGGGPHHTQGVKVLCHSPMVQSVNAVYAEFLNQNKAGEPDKRRYRNESLVGALNLENEAAVDAVLTLLFSPQKGAGPVKLGDGHSIEQLGRGRMRRAGVDADIIIATSGMCDAGPIVDYLQQVAGDRANTILLTGYQGKSTTGASLRELVGRGQDEEPIKLEGLGVVRAEVCDISGYYSGHADPRGVREFIESSRFKNPPKPVTVFLNHGTIEAKNAIRKLIQDRPPQQDRRPVERVIVTDSEEMWFDTESNAFVSMNSEQATIDELNRELEGLRRELAAA
jgi:metallo-beta-lactamase family protein